MMTFSNKMKRVNQGQDLKVGETMTKTSLT